jgi:hypothetical protein
VRDPDVGEQETEVVVDLRDRADRGARVRAGGLLLDGNGRRQALDQVDIRLLHLLEELPGVCGQRFDIPPLPFGIDGIEGQRRLARAGQPGDDDQPVARQIDIDVLQVVNAGAPHRDPVVGHTYSQVFGEKRKPSFYQRVGSGPKGPPLRSMSWPRSVPNVAATLQAATEKRF